MRVLLLDPGRLSGQTLSQALSRSGATVELRREAPGPDDLARPDVDLAVLNVRGALALAAASVQALSALAPRARLVCLVESPEGDVARGLAQAGVEVVGRGRRLAEVISDLLGGSAAPGPRPGTAQPRPPAVPGPLLARFLTPRERRVLALLAGGSSTQSIADVLGITAATARGYVQSVLTKLGVHTRVEAVAYAARHRILTGEVWDEVG